MGDAVGLVVRLWVSESRGDSVSFSVMGTLGSGAEAAAKEGSPCRRRVLIFILGLVQGVLLFSYRLRKSVRIVVLFFLSELGEASTRH